MCCGLLRVTSLQCRLRQVGSSRRTKPKCSERHLQSEVNLASALKFGFAARIALACAPHKTPREVSGISCVRCSRGQVRMAEVQVLASRLTDKWRVQNYRWGMHALRCERAHGQHSRRAALDGGRWMVDDGRAWHPVAAASLFEWTRVAH